ncbi:hypothetical protein MPTK1_8g03640 [Marchantia polymorpha subsp. ruderalis]|uniref:Uncharacterized protein n=1 Tax=Marchantia polymorpha TaxID=3197 RepID=A0A2R6XJJ2_MARPO|nr:hypothetical protein MARPO_0012s0154 [Marchantia polymorpha]BBN18579.1 hypothetical protein Mp_8g03640 [Marchantia polymorpha subsp. ruderalis]|eukprot:PTQ46226.1 hypothetical protein MARPO_0012s0154 [Marchantia polymorpha]
MARCSGSDLDPPWRWVCYLGDTASWEACFTARGFSPWDEEGCPAAQGPYPLTFARTLRTSTALCRCCMPAALFLREPSLLLGSLGRSYSLLGLAHTISGGERLTSVAKGRGLSLLRPLGPLLGSRLRSPPHGVGSLPWGSCLARRVPRRSRFLAKGWRRVPRRSGAADLRPNSADLHCPLPLLPARCTIFARPPLPAA